MAIPFKNGFSVEPLPTSGKVNDAEEALGTSSSRRGKAISVTPPIVACIQNALGKQPVVFPKGNVDYGVL